jgi:hypothetical protein
MFCKYSVHQFKHFNFTVLYTVYTINACTVTFLNVFVLGKGLVSKYFLMGTLEMKMLWAPFKSVKGTDSRRSC